VNKALPFILNLILFIAGGVLAWMAGREASKVQQTLAEENHG